MLIKSINWIITDACNLRCKHCDIWKLSSQMMSDGLVEKLLTDPVVEKSYNYYGKKFDIGLGGGELFIYPKLQEIVTRLNQKYPGSLKSLSTNGVLTKRIVRFLKNNPGLNLKLNISIDGLKDTHDKIRGVPGAFDKTIQTVRIIKHYFPRQRIELKMTIMRDNFSEISDVYRLSQRLGCAFTCKPLDYMEHYTNRVSVVSTAFEENEICSIRNQLFPIADELLRNREYKKARFTKDIPFHIFGKRKHVSCSVLWDHIIVMVNGDVFFCPKEEKAGNIFNNSLIEMETKPKDFKCKSCILMCGSYKDYENVSYQETVVNVDATLECNLRRAMCTQKELRAPGTAMKSDNFSH